MEKSTNIFVVIGIFILMMININCGEKETDDKVTKTDTAIKKNNQTILDTEKVDERWIYYLTNINNGKHYYDKKTLKHEKKDKYQAEGYNIWEMIKYQEDQIFNYDNKDNDYAWCKGKKYREVKIYFWLECETKMIYVRERTTFFNDGTTLTQNNFRREYITPETSSEKLSEILCEKENE